MSGWGPQSIMASQAKRDLVAAINKAKAESEALHVASGRIAEVTAELLELFIGVAEYARSERIWRQVVFQGDE